MFGQSVGNGHQPSCGSSLQTKVAFPVVRYHIPPEIKRISSHAALPRPAIAGILHHANGCSTTARIPATKRLIGRTAFVCVVPVHVFERLCQLVPWDKLVALAEKIAGATTAQTDVKLSRNVG